MKQCTVCKNILSLFHFSKHKRLSDGHRNQCKACTKIYSKQYKKNNRDKILSNARKKYQENKQIDLIRNKIYRNNNSNAIKNKHLVYTYGISLIDFNILLKNQNNKCAICFTESCKTGDDFCVDHDHLTGKVRGLLCRCCNLGIGHLKDNTEYIQNAFNYLMKNK